MTYSQDEQERMAKLLANVLTYTTKHAKGNIRIAASMATSLLFTFLQIMAETAGLRAAHLFIDSVIEHLQMLRKATTVDEFAETYYAVARGEVAQDGTLDPRKEH